MESLTSHTDYGAVSLNESGVNPDPMVEFDVWLAAAEQAGLYEPNAMVLSTVDPEGWPSSRTVLLKGLDGSGFEFVTNYASRKGRALSVNPDVSLLFPWYAMQRQVIVYGTASPTDAATSDAYFVGRPRASRVAAVASDQSRPIASRALIEEQVRRVEERYPDDTDIPRPDDWGGFRVVPSAIEFWQGRTSRLHDRLRFTAGDAGSWTMERLQP
ncbi:pyridoxamine 5'-phosphate oxidase [Cryobacterium sp. TMT1-66-1]|uniref:pyridoxamine 5'-phosphate oxidase n=1 Tax=Cryobacterium sp. TMT1-66-1 TaxID=1259242 RepID=UPI0015808B9E|nr:pyridoxamine 5'-phosphate oxidase [Cryobacterium sp. TMT1-66-1]